MGRNTTSSGDGSTAMGQVTSIASGTSSVAMGNLTFASGSASTAMGSSARATGDHQHRPMGVQLGGEWVRRHGHGRQWACQRQPKHVTRLPNHCQRSDQHRDGLGDACGSLVTTVMGTYAVATAAAPGFVRLRRSFDRGCWQRRRYLERAQRIQGARRRRRAVLTNDMLSVGPQLAVGVSQRLDVFDNEQRNHRRRRRAAAGGVRQRRARCRWASRSCGNARCTAGTRTTTLDFHRRAAWQHPLAIRHRRCRRHHACR